MHWRTFEISDENKQVYLYSVIVKIETNLCPLTDPSFLPDASSNSTPHQSPDANCVEPLKRKIPTRLPDAFLTITRSPVSGIMPKSHKSFHIKIFATQNHHFF